MGVRVRHVRVVRVRLVPVGNAPVVRVRLAPAVSAPAVSAVGGPAVSVAVKVRQGADYAEYQLVDVEQI